MGNESTKVLDLVGKAIPGVSLLEELISPSQKGNLPSPVEPQALQNGLNQLLKSSPAESNNLYKLFLQSEGLADLVLREELQPQKETQSKDLLSQVLKMAEPLLPLLLL